MKNLDAEKANGTSVHVEIDVTKIVKYVCLAGVLIVGCIFGNKSLGRYIDTLKTED